MYGVNGVVKTRRLWEHSWRVNLEMDGDGGGGGGAMETICTLMHTLPYQIGF